MTSFYWAECDDHRAHAFQQRIAWGKPTEAACGLVVVPSVDGGLGTCEGCIATADRRATIRE